MLIAAWEAWFWLAKLWVEEFNPLSLLHKAPVSTHHISDRRMVISSLSQLLILRVTFDCFEQANPCQNIPNPCWCWNEQLDKLGEGDVQYHFQLEPGNYITDPLGCSSPQKILNRSFSHAHLRSPGGSKHMLANIIYAQPPIFVALQQQWVSRTRWTAGWPYFFAESQLVLVILL